jgi:phosphotriesterase-related protein
MKVRTVCEDISPGDLGLTLPHEHLLIDVSLRRRNATDAYLNLIAQRPVDCTIVSDLRRNPLISEDSLRLTDVDLAIEELGYFREAGGRSLVDPSTRWIGGDPVALKRISQITGINIVAGSGYYSPALPKNIDDLTIDQLAKTIIKEVTQGFEGVDIRAGIIGEIGTTWPLSASEEKILRAAAQAQIATGAALSIHPSPWDKPALVLLDIVESEGADLSRVVMCHLDHVMDLEYHEAVASRGAYVEYDRFGVEWYRSLAFSLQTFPRDTERVAGIVELIAKGYVNQILISHDVCQKIELKKYGGHGYGHIPRSVVPLMRAMGIAENTIDAILVSNPRRMLSF